MYSKLPPLKLITNKRMTKETYSQDRQRNTWQNLGLDVQTALITSVPPALKNLIILVILVKKQKDMLMLQFVVSA
jgi:hypothetical protein